MCFNSFTELDIALGKIQTVYQPTSKPTIEFTYTRFLLVVDSISSRTCRRNSPSLPRSAFALPGSQFLLRLRRPFLRICNAPVFSLMVQSYTFHAASRPGSAAGMSVGFDQYLVTPAVGLVDCAY